MALLTDVKIKFISLVAKAANKKRFAIVKSEDGKLELDSFILKQDDDKRLVTCVVYEPDVKDTQGDYMTAEDIEKAAHDFLSKYREGVDLQHDEKVVKVDVVESWITKSDSIIGGQDIKKGTWMATVRVNDDLIWKAIKDGSLTGFSMGGTAKKINKNDNMEGKNMDEIKKMLEELIAKGASQKALDDLISKVTKAEETIQKMETASKEQETVRKAQETEITSLKETIQKMDEAFKDMTAPGAGAESIEKAEQDYSENIRKATLTTGASLVPKSLSNQMVKDMKEVAPFFNDAQMITATGTTIRVPVRKPAATTTAKSKKEGVATAAGETNFTEIEISKGVIQSIIPITDELRRDSQFNVASLVREYGVEDIAEEIALRTYNGVTDTDNKIEGFSKNAALAARSTMLASNSAITLDELLSIRKNIKPQYWSGSKYYVSKDVYFQMKSMKDLQGRPLWQESQITGTPSTFDGYPVILCWQMDTEFPVLFANFRKLYMYFVDYQMESEMERSGKAGVNDEILRARLGGKVVNEMAGYMLKKKV